MAIYAFQRWCLTCRPLPTSNDVLIMFFSRPHGLCAGIAWAAVALPLHPAAICKPWASKFVFKIAFQQSSIPRGQLSSGTWGRIGYTTTRRHLKCCWQGFSNHWAVLQCSDFVFRDLERWCRTGWHVLQCAAWCRALGGVVGAARVVRGQRWHRWLDQRAWVMVDGGVGVWWRPPVGGFPGVTFLH